MTEIPVIHGKPPVCAVKGCSNPAVAYVVDDDLLVYRLCDDCVADMRDKLPVSFMPPVMRSSQYPAKC